MNPSRPLFVLVLLLVAFVTLTPFGAAQARPRPFRPELALDQLRRERGRVDARTDARTGAVRFVKGNLGGGAPRDAERIARAFFAQRAELFGLQTPENELVLRSIDRDRRGYASIRFSQQLGGMPVLGGDIRAEIDQRGTLHSVHGEIIPFPQPQSLNPRLTAAEASRRARAAIGSRSTMERPPELIVVRVGAADFLAWEMLLQTDEPARWHLLIDAHRGGIIEQRDILNRERDRRTYSANFSAELPGELRRREGQPRTGDAHVDAAHENAGQVYDYLWETFRRDSLDGRGLPIMSTVHFGRAYNNAFWDGTQVVFGDGDGVLFGPWGSSLDVVAHELIHGLTDFTAHLVYYGQSGALNESYSDIFAALVDTANWEIAEEIYTPGRPGDALRSLADPTLYDQPSKWGEYLELPPTAAYDYGGVHANSGILNHIAWRIARDLGREKLAQIFYRTLTMKLTSRADFDDVRDLTIQSCAELVGLYAITGNDCRVVQAAFAGAGLGEDPAPPGGLPYQVFLPLAAVEAPQCGKNSLRNMDFELGTKAWPNTGGIIDRWGRQRSGAWSARVNEGDQLLQLAGLPADALEGTISFWVYKEGGSPDAQIEISLEDATTHMDLAASTVGLDLEAGAWQKITLDSSRLGERPVVRLVIEHSSGSGVFYLDDVSLEIACGT